MSAIDTMRSNLIAWANIQGVDNVSDALLNDCLTRALMVHNSAYPSLDALPAREQEAVTILAWINLCYIRAARFATTGSVQGANGFGTNRDTPYYKLMDMVKQLQARYTELVVDLNIPDANTGVVVSTLKVKDEKWDALVPLFTGENFPPLIASIAIGDNNTEVIISWAQKPFDNFLNYTIFSLEGTAPVPALFQSWNNSSMTSFRCINNNAVNIGSWNDYAIKSVKVQGINPTLTTRFIVVVQSRSNNFAYSIEMVWPPA